MGIYTPTIKVIKSLISVKVNDFFDTDIFLKSIKVVIKYIFTFIDFLKS